MSKPLKAREFARKHVGFWQRTNDREVSEGRPAYSLEHMLDAAWRTGYDAGQNHQRKLQREKVIK